MLVRTLAVPTTATNLATFLGDATIRGKGVALQAPAVNAENVFFGDAAMQPAFVPPGGSSDVMPIAVLSDLYLLGTVGDNVIVMVF